MSKEHSNLTITIGGSLGASIAVVLSWTAWHSIWWTILHGIFGWFYVIYYAINYLQ